METIQLADKKDNAAKTIQRAVRRSTLLNRGFVLL